jgi:dienelactone hydrolase
MTPRRRRLWWIAGAAAALALALMAGAGGNALFRYRGWSVERLDPAALSALLAPAYRIVRPEGPGPFPTALLYSGCDGPHDNLDRWAEALKARGWAAIIVDSHGPRGLTNYEVWRLICAGQLFMGSERAGDVLVSLDDARAMDFVDPRRMALIGASHGGWAIMELLALDPPAALPFNLAALPAGAPEDPLDGVVGVLLLYPYCGPGNRARPEGWRQPIPTLFLVSDSDTVAPAESCLALAGRMQDRGLPVETHVLAGVTHGFDQQNRSVLSTLEFDPEATAAALGLGADFLDRAAKTAR